MASSDSSHWEQLSPLPRGTFNDNYKHNLMKMDSTHFSTVCNGIVTYDTNGDNWNVENPKILNNTNGASCYNPISKQIFIVEEHVRTKTMHIFDIEANKLTKFGTSFGESIEPIWVNSCCHFIGGGINGNLHEIWNDDTKKLQHIHTFHEFARVNHTFSGFKKFGLIYSSKRKELLLFGGKHNEQPPLDMIYRYSLLTRNWVKLDHKLPRKMYGFGCVMTKCQRYIIILGEEHEVRSGRYHDYWLRQEIFIFEPATMQFIKSKIKLPFGSGCKAIIMDDKHKNDLLVHGFVKKSINKYNMNIPFALISLIGVWHSMEYIHVIEACNSKNPRHWKINVDEIIKTK